MVFSGISLEIREKYNIKPDEQVVILANSGNLEALEYLIIKYKSLVKSKVFTYYIVGADRDDIIQEGMIGLYKAIKSFDEKKSSSFKNFADMCVTSQIITAIKTASRQKHMPLNKSISLNKPLYGENSNSSIIDSIESASSKDPMDIFISKEDLDLMEKKIQGMLSSLERNVLTNYLEGKSYEEIGFDLSINPKSIDNAIQRIKRKVERYVINRV
ncbi:MAG: RNA polymerase sporulation sigma factor SigH [Gudongella sp.]|nr:RNA polymerase sporulation sigma factor SigH [Gudongella sp.]